MTAATAAKTAAAIPTDEPERLMAPDPLAAEVAEAAAVPLVAEPLAVESDLTDEMTDPTTDEAPLTAEAILEVALATAPVMVVEAWKSQRVFATNHRPIGGTCSREGNMLKTGTWEGKGGRG